MVRVIPSAFEDLVFLKIVYFKFVLVEASSWYFTHWVEVLVVLWGWGGEGSLPSRWVAMGSPCVLGGGWVIAASLPIAMTVKKRR